jgi:hypothetical protein
LDRQPHRGTLILVLGILGLVVCAPLAIAAWVMVSGDLKQMEAGTMDPTGRGSTQAGKICGISGTVLLIISLIVVGIIFAFVLAAGLAQHH